MKKLVVLTGAGISAESGISTFRGTGGLWEGYDVMEVASIEGWVKNPALVLDFYNKRRKQALEVQPNQGHKILAELEEHFETTIVTQNVDDLHEQAGSSKVIHLHGSLFESKGELFPDIVYPINGWELKWGEKCPNGSQLRPNIVWFGEGVPKMEEAVEITNQADIFLVVGTSLQVYPAAGLLQFTSRNVKKIVVDPGKMDFHKDEEVVFINEKATTGLVKVKKLLFA